MARSGSRLGRRPLSRVRADLRIAPCAVELRVRRVRFWQAAARHPLDNRQVMAAVFGETLFDGPVVQQGCLVETANEWACLFREDLLSLGEFEEGEVPAAATRADVLAVFRQGDTRECVLRFDPVVLRPAACTVAVPPGLPGPEQVDAEIAAPIPQPFRCGLRDAEGVACTRSFASLCAVRRHQLGARGGSMVNSRASACLR